MTTPAQVRHALLDIIRRAGHTQTTFAPKVGYKHQPSFNRAMRRPDLITVSLMLRILAACDVTLGELADLVSKTDRNKGKS